MARPVEFDVDRARERAMLLFWRKGYQAASLPDLLEATGIGRSSFYAAFGDKRALFEACLDLFAERTRGILRRARADRPPLDALRHFLERHLERDSRGEAGLGCLLVNTVLETAGVDDVLSERASGHLAEIERLFGETLRDAGCAPARAAEFAAMLMLLNEGVRVASRRRLAADAQRGPIDTAFRLLRAEIDASAAGAEPTRRPARRGRPVPGRER